MAEKGPDGLEYLQVINAKEASPIILNEGHLDGTDATDDSLAPLALRVKIITILFRHCKINSYFLY